MFYGGPGTDGTFSSTYTYLRQEYGGTAYFIVQRMFSSPEAKTSLWEIGVLRTGPRGFRLARQDRSRRHLLPSSSRYGRAIDGATVGRLVIGGLIQRLRSMGLARLLPGGWRRPLRL